MQEHLGQLMQLALFRHNIPKEDLERLLRHAALHTFPAGSTVYAQGDPATDTLLVCKGSVACWVEAGGARVDLSTVSEGEILGEVALFTEGGTRTAHATAVTDVIGLEIGRDLFQRAPRNAAIIALEERLLHAMCRRLRRTNLEVRKLWKDEQASEPLPARLLNLLRGRG